ncbi:MAG: alpha/beta hydrolase [Betaproteobacteria bacterium]|nr:alpha/beta hydrolase [Betaproteobacteria bacterium]
MTIAIVTSRKKQELEYIWFTPEFDAPSPGLQPHSPASGRENDSAVCKTSPIPFAGEGSGERTDCAASSLEKNRNRSGVAPLVFLHEGLGSIALWRSFPQKLCERVQRRGIAYSRYGYGNSTPRPLEEPLPPDYLEHEASETLPAFLNALHIERPWLIGHSDGGTIALLAAAGKVVPLAGIVVIAPHYFVEDICLAGIERARSAYETDGLRVKLARYHQGTDSVFYGWHNVWTDPNRRDWNIAAELEQIACPLLAIQGREDEYATLEQIEGIKRRAPHTELVVVENCGHFPHFIHADTVIERIAAFVEKVEA